MTVYSIYSNKLSGPVELNAVNLDPVAVSVIEMLLSEGGYPCAKMEGRITLVRQPNAQWTSRELAQRDDFRMARMMLPSAVRAVLWREPDGMERIQLFPSEEMFEAFKVPGNASGAIFARIDDDNREWVSESIAEVLAKYKERQTYYILKGIY